MPDEPRRTYISGLDLGQASDFTALAVLERKDLPDPEHKGQRIAHYAVRHLQRFPLGTSYPAIVKELGTLFANVPLKGTVLAVDQTGVGRAVVDMLKAGYVPASLMPVTITAGLAATRNDQGQWLVPKKDLVGVMQVLLQARRLQVSTALTEAATLVKELENFRVKVTLAANEVYGAWREGQHDDLVLAVAIAAWAGERGSATGGWLVPERTEGGDNAYFSANRSAAGMGVADWRAGGGFMGVR